MTTHHLLRKRLYDQAGIRRQAASIHELRYTQWSAEFERLMRNRLLMGAFRYGPMGEQGVGDVPAYRNIESAKRKLEQYQATGNLECLVDAANLCLVEFENSLHPRAHFAAVDDGEHTNPR